MSILLTNEERLNIMIISTDEQNKIIKWVVDNHKSFLNVSFNSLKRKFDYDSELPGIFMKVRERIINLEGLEEINKEERNINLYYKNVISYMYNGSKLKTHKDQKYKGYVFTKYIVYIQLPNIGGLPIYNDVIYHVKEKSYLKYEASEVFHSCQNVIGDIPRIVLTFGFLI